MPPKGFKTTTIRQTEYQLAKKLAKNDHRSISGLVEILITREAKKEGIIA
ncbi:MAG: hypothetical protein ACKO7N_06670 [Candidatus Nitrosotenuis sp.]